MSAPTSLNTRAMRSQISSIIVERTSGLYTVYPQIGKQLTRCPTRAPFAMRENRRSVQPALAFGEPAGGPLGVMDDFAFQVEVAGVRPVGDGSLTAIADGLRIECRRQRGVTVLEQARIGLRDKIGSSLDPQPTMPCMTCSPTCRPGGMDLVGDLLQSGQAVGEQSSGRARRWASSETTSAPRSRIRPWRTRPPGRRSCG